VPERTNEESDEWWESTSALLFTAEDKAAFRAASAEPDSLVESGESSQDERPTEWFSALPPEGSEPAEVLPRRDHHVTVVLVTHDGAAWLPSVLTGLANQTRPPDAAVAIDTESSDHSLTLLRASFGVDRVVTGPSRQGFGQAVRRGLEHIGRVEAFSGGAASGQVTQWVWLLHDDSAPDPTCLDALLKTADDYPSASVLGPKILGWHDRRLLLEAGVSISNSGRRLTGLERGEHDQGQHDGVRDVLSVSSAGMLVRREIWDLLGGFDPELKLFRDDLDFCWRAQRSGARVLIATDAIVHHREAATHGSRSSDVASRPHRAERVASVHVLLAHCTALAAPFVALRLLFGSAMRSLAYLLGKDLGAARDEIVAVFVVAFHPWSLRRSRKRVKATASEPASIVRHLRPQLAWQMRQGLEAIAGIVTTSGASSGQQTSALDSGPIDDDASFLSDQSSGLIRRLILRPGTVLTAALGLFALVALWGLWWGGGTLQGGALLPSPGSAADLWDRYSQAWHDVGPGSTVPSAPYLMVIYPLALLLLGKAWLAVNVLLLLAMPIAGWAVYFTLRGVVASTAIRVWAGVAYALLPAMAGAISSGRIGTTMAAILLPFAVRSCVRISRPQGTFRRAAGTAILIAALTACVPIMWVIAVILAIGATVIGITRYGRSASRMIRRIWFAVLTPVLLLWPWSADLFLHPSLFLFEPGVTSRALSDSEVTAVDVLLLHPGGPGMTPVWLSAGLLLAGLLAFMRRDRIRAVALAWVVGLVALIIGVLQTVVLVTPPDSAIALRPWPGPATLLLGLSVIGAAAYAADGLRARVTRADFNLMQPIGFLIALLAIAAPAGSAVLWAPVAAGELRKGPMSAVPAFVAADAVSPQAPRTLVLRQDSAGRVRYSLINGTGPQLGDADVAPAAAVWMPLDALVADLASGRGGDEVTGLSAYGVRYVLLAAGTSAELIPVLDGEPGLRRLSSAGGEVLWRIAGTTSRARLIAGAEQTSIGVNDGRDLTAAPYIDQGLPDGTGARYLAIGTTPDPAWRAVAITPVTGEAVGLPAVAVEGASGWSQAFATPEGTPQVIVDFNGSERSRWLWIQFGVLILLIVLALPSRKKADLDSEDDAGIGGIAVASGSGAFVMAGPGSAERAIAPDSAPDLVSDAVMSSASDESSDVEAERLSGEPGPTATEADPVFAETEPVAAEQESVSSEPAPVVVEPDNAIGMPLDSEVDVAPEAMPSTDSEDRS
jgi:GT2 family glycosyltransferase